MKSGLTCQKWCMCQLEVPEKNQNAKFQPSNQMYPGPAVTTLPELTCKQMEEMLFKIPSHQLRVNFTNYYVGGE